jgi:hypothetical protein
MNDDFKFTKENQSFLTMVAPPAPFLDWKTESFRLQKKATGSREIKHPVSFQLL